jgi:primosomal protein N' (replication factor Y)
LSPHGFGTERVEEEVRRLLPEAGVVRIDRDTAGRPEEMVQRLDAVRRRKADVLIGTQMIAKGHDFPDITLVGVLNADTALQIADFRAGESTVQLLIQVAGRAGRGDEPGRVILQTYSPSHYTLEAVVTMDYSSFCTRELHSRELLQYPPYTRLLKLLITAGDEASTRDAAMQLGSLCREVATALRAENCHVAVLGPAPAPLVKLKSRYRWHLFIKAWTNGEMDRFVSAVLEQSKSHPALRRVQLAVDRDPMTSV